MPHSLVSAGLGEPGSAAATAVKGAARRGGRRSVGVCRWRSGPEVVGTGQAPAGQTAPMLCRVRGGKGGLDTEGLLLSACRLAWEPLSRVTAPLRCAGGWRCRDRC